MAAAPAPVTVMFKFLNAPAPALVWSPQLGNTAGHHNDPDCDTKSRTAVVILLNGVPVSWRSNKQPDTSISPAEAEIYALSEGMRDARHTCMYSVVIAITRYRAV